MYSTDHKCKEQRENTLVCFVCGTWRTGISMCSRGLWSSAIPLQGQNDKKDLSALCMCVYLLQSCHQWDTGLCLMVCNVKCCWSWSICSVWVWSCSQHRGFCTNLARSSKKRVLLLSPLLACCCHPACKSQVRSPVDPGWQHCHRTS